MGKKIYVVAIFVAALVIAGFMLYTSADAQKAAPAAAPSEKPVKVETCYACHAPIKDFHSTGKHAKVNCVSCHSGLEKHLTDVKSRPGTRKDHMACGICHKEQYESFFTMNWKRTAKMEKSLATGKSPNPSWDLLMMPHGFTREHNMQRSHAFMLIDHFLVDRAYGGRFQPKEGWAFYAKSGDLKAWDVLMEKYTEDAHKPFMHGTGAFANPVCLNCKTQDHILDWAYMGDKHPRAKWDRTSKVYQFAKDLNHPINCYGCHDPHSTKPRVVRDALIQAVVDRGEGTYPYDKEKSKKTTMTKVTFQRDGADFRAIGILNRPDSVLMCAQCHVEYNCNPGLEFPAGTPVGMADRRSNLFQWTNVWDYDKKTEEVFKFRDFRHGITGAMLTKFQHPEVETFWGSKHERAGVECKDCHMPKVTDPKTKKTYTSHWQTNPRNYIKETCLKCHPAWDETKAVYVIDSVKNHLWGKMRKAEHWLTQLINKFIEARAVGVDEAVLKEAREKHYHAHTHWEWWTAETSGGFHNIDQAKESLNTSMIRSMEGIQILEEAIKAKRGTDTTFTTPVRAKHFIGVEPVR
jgi:formate-dependent nitrite reductase cytochrome c552 subunit